ncbi:Microtubule-associated serine/threonine-protein kinase 2 [Bagarius yarrelli]|uniref:Microtubule-associated serine/threonine-protein kinase 2 n=1 Tax=Bagarius yarrelli TaxID=175774 RepID=A0A556TY31_BAGYA|nr:Microtubule-associated serine/threonine-protein kinase 2 [Bagarius yarrelli]
MKRTENKQKRKLCSTEQHTSEGKDGKEVVVHPTLLFRKLSNPDLSTAAGKTKLQRQLSQDDSRARRSSMAAGLTDNPIIVSLDDLCLILSKTSIEGELKKRLCPSSPSPLPKILGCLVTCLSLKQRLKTVYLENGTMDDSSILRRRGLQLKTGSGFGLTATGPEHIAAQMVEALGLEDQDPSPVHAKLPLLGSYLSPPQAPYHG